MRIMIVLMNIIRMAMILMLICFAYRMIIIMKLAHDENNDDNDVYNDGSACNNDDGEGDDNPGWHVALS